MPLPDYLKQLCKNKNERKGRVSTWQRVSKTLLERKQHPDKLAYIVTLQRKWGMMVPGDGRPDTFEAFLIGMMDIFECRVKMGHG